MQLRPCNTSQVKTIKTTLSKPVNAFLIYAVTRDTVHCPIHVLRLVKV